MRQRIYDYNKYVNTYKQDYNGIKPSEREVMKALNLSVKQYDRMMLAIVESTMCSLDDSIGDDESDLTLVDTIADDQDDYSEIEDKNTLATLWDNVEELNEQNKYIINERYKNNRTQTELASEMCKSNARIQQIEHKAL